MALTSTPIGVAATTEAASGGAFSRASVTPSLGRPTRVTYIERVTIADQSTTTDLAQSIPANHILVRAEMVFSTAVVLATAVKVGLGINGDPDSVLLSGTTLTKNTHTSGSPRTWQDTTAAVTYRITSCDTNGASAAKFNAATTIDVYLDFDVYLPLPDAA